MEQQNIDTSLVSFCGLHCEDCSKYKKQKCAGCAQNEKATWCKIRQCCLEKNIKSCADCDIYTSPKECKKFSNMVSKLFEFVFRSDRLAGIRMIQTEGYESFADHMKTNKLVCIKKQRPFQKQNNL